MSLINDMLRNLEAKQPDDLAKQNLQREIRSLPAAKPGNARIRVMLLTGLLMLAAGLAWWQFDGHFPPLPDESPVVAVVPPPPATLPVLPTPTESPVVDVQPAVIPDSLRLAEGLTVLPMPAAPVLPVPDPVAPAIVAKAEAEQPKVAQPGNAGPVRIEKSPVMATPRDRADAEFRKAENAVAAGRSSEATELLRAALKIDPGHVQVRQTLLRQLLDQRKLDEAMAVLVEGLELQPAQTGWAMSLARLQLEQGDLAAADRTLAHSQAYAEANADYAGFQGHLKSRLNAHRQAAAHYLRATRLSPREGRWLLGLGLALEAEGKNAESKDALRRALATTTLSPELTAVAEQHLR